MPSAQKRITEVMVWPLALSGALFLASGFSFHSAVFAEDSSVSEKSIPATNDRSEKLSLLKRLMENVHAPSTVNVDDVIGEQEKKVIASIEETSDLSSDEKKQRKEAYITRTEKKVARLKQLLDEKHIDLTQAYMNAIVDECDKTWSIQDYRDVVAYSGLINSHLFKSFKGNEFGEICERAGNRATAVLQPVLDELQAEEKAGKFSDPGATASGAERFAEKSGSKPAISSDKPTPQTPEREEKVAVLRKMFDVIHVAVDVDSIMEQGTKKNLELIDKEEKLSASEKQQQKDEYSRKAAKETARLKQLLSERHIDFGDLYTGALIDELDKVWTMKDYRDLSTLLKLENAPVIKKFPEQWPDICSSAGKQVAATLGPVLNQLETDEKEGKFD